MTGTDPAAAVLANEIDQALQRLPDHRTQTVRALRQSFTRKLAKASPGFIFELADRLLEMPLFEHRFVAYELVSHHRRALGSLDAAQLERLGRGIDSWYAVDTFGLYLAGPAWRERQVKEALIESWAQSSDRWWRRAALVSTVPLNLKSRGGTGDLDRTLKVCERLVDDRDDMVVKALSWALRELSKREPAAVSEFLRRHEPRLAARVLREVRNKLRTGLKNPRT